MASPSQLRPNARLTDRPPAPATPAHPVARESRAVARAVESGSYVDCAWCAERVKFRARVRAKQIICNVYEDGRWVRVEHYHDSCYDTAGNPHGPAR